MGNVENRQATFDTVVRAMVAQGKKSMSAPLPGECGVCQYRGAGGTRCAAGVLIPDELYHQSMEGGVVMRLTYMGKSDPRDKRITDIILAQGHDPELVAALQSCHDGCPEHDFVDAFTLRARSVAAEFNIDASACYP